jgi:protein-tyrosine-phosphatase
MAEHHKEFLDMHFPRYKENVFLLKTFSTGTEKPQNTSIEDPIGGDLKFYRKTINEIDKELDRILPQLRTLIDYKLSNKN